MMKVEVEVVTFWNCESCDQDWEAADVEEAGPTYECGECGHGWSRAENDGAARVHQCPECNKFGSRVGDIACPDCGGTDEPVEKINLLYQGTYYAEKGE